MTAPIVTLAMLLKLDACEDQVALFSRLFPTGAARVEASKAYKAAMSEAFADAFIAQHTIGGTV